MTRKQFHCENCGQLVGEYQIKDGLGGIGFNISSYCFNYCNVCGKKIDTKKFKESMNVDMKKIQKAKEISKIFEKEYEELFLKTLEKRKRGISK